MLTASKKFPILPQPARVFQSLVHFGRGISVFMCDGVKEMQSDPGSIIHMLTERYWVFKK